MSHASLKEQLEAVASQLSDGVEKKELDKKPGSKIITKPSFKTKNAHIKSKPKWLDYVHYGVELLKAYFPDCFNSGTQVRPLKKGIKQDLVKRLSTMDAMVIEDKACMVKSLAYYVNTQAYHKSVVEQAVRIDLDGGSAGMVSAEEAKYSIERQHAKAAKKNNASLTNVVHDQENNTL